MRRRAYLASAALALTSLAGCPGAASDEPETVTPAPVPTVTTASTDGGRESEEGGMPTLTGSAVVERAIHQYGYVWTRRDGGMTFADEDDPFLFVTVLADDTLSRWDFELVVGERTFSTVFDTNLHRIVLGTDQRYLRERDHGILQFRCGTVEPDDRILLRWPGGEHRFPPFLRDRLRSPPPTFDGEVEVRAGDGGDPAVTMHNESEFDARFVGAVWREDPEGAVTPVGVVNRLLTPGERREWTIQTRPPGVSTPTPDDGDAEDDSEDVYVLRYRGAIDTADVG